MLFIFSLSIVFGLDYFFSGKYLAGLLKIKNVDSLEDDILKAGLTYAIITVGLIGPLIEEALMRYYLISFKWNYAVLPLFFGFLMIALFHIENTIALSIIIVASLLCSRLIYTKIKKSTTFKLRLIRFYINHYGFFFYLSAITFGVLHISNYQIEHFIPILPILLVLPQIFMGIVLGYIRITMGIGWSVAFHCLHNLFCISILFSTHHL